MAGPVFSVNVIGQPALPEVQLFNDTFDSGVLDTTNRWNVPQTSGGATVSTVIGATTLTGGSGANSTAVLNSQPLFRPTEPGFLVKVARLNFEYPILPNWYRFFGLATVPAFPTLATPVIEAAGFDIGTNGKLTAVTFQTGVRVPIQDLSKIQPQDGNAHKYWIYFRGDFVVWALDDPGNVVAEITTGANGPNANTLGVTQVLISSGGAAGAIMGINGVNVSDSSRTTTTLSDGSFGWRKQSVTSSGAALVQLSPAASTDGALPANIAEVSIGLVNSAGTFDRLRTDGGGRLKTDDQDLLQKVLREVRLTNQLLAIGLNITDDLDNLRNEPSEDDLSGNLN